jgi:4-hydroxy-tetrahydrodipicolinate reductase
MKIALIGYGKMGKAIESIAVERGHEIVLKIDITNQADFTQERLQLADVAIEFTGPHSAFDNICACIDAGVPVISGSTGWLTELEKVQNKCTQKNGALLYASNFSIGVNLFFELNQHLAKLMSRYPLYDVSIEEIHHTEKKDAPSGTAITIAEQILQINHHKKNWVNQPAAASAELAIISKRIDPAPGTHTVKYSSVIDDIEITHTAHNRTGFATGAVLAAEFLQNKNGIFSMKEVLGL